MQDKQENKRVCDMAQSLDLKVLCEGERLESVPNGKIYCCDLLSIVMGRAPADGVWITVMANINAVAVAVLCELACIVIAEGMQVDEATLAKAREQEVTVLHTDLPVYDIAKKIDGYLNHEA